MDVRRVVTGDREDGKSRVVSDGAPPTLYQATVAGGVSCACLWATGPSSLAPNAGSDPTPAVTDYVPAAGETRGLIFEIAAPTADPSTLDLEAIAVDAASAMPGLGEHIDEEGWHRTICIDYWLLLEGEMTMALADGSETTMRQGDVVIQNGTSHAWRNSGSGPAKVFAVLVGVPEG